MQDRRDPNQPSIYIAERGPHRRGRRQQLPDAGEGHHPARDQAHGHDLDHLLRALCAQPVGALGRSDGRPRRRRRRQGRSTNRANARPGSCSTRIRTSTTTSSRTVASGRSCTTGCRRRSTRSPSCSSPSPRIGRSAHDAPGPGRRDPGRDPDRRRDAHRRLRRLDGERPLSASRRRCSTSCRWWQS